MFLEIKTINKNVHQQHNLILEDLHLLDLSQILLHKNLLHLLPNFNNKVNKSFDNKNKKSQDIKKSQTKKSTLKPIDDDFNKANVKKILEQEEQEYDKFPSLAKLKRAREKEKLKAQEKESETKISREVFVPEIITVQELANQNG